MLGIPNTLLGSSLVSRPSSRLSNILLLLILHRYALGLAGPSTTNYKGKPCLQGWTKNLCLPFANLIF